MTEARSPLGLDRARWSRRLGVRAAPTAESVGGDLVGPVLLEFCARLQDRVSAWGEDEDRILLFCARGGLRLQLAYERFLVCSGREQVVPGAPLMVSRLVAMRAALVRVLSEPDASVPPAIRRAIERDFGGFTIGATLRSLVPAGVQSSSFASSARTDPHAVLAALRDEENDAMTQALITQTALFERHLRESLHGRRRPVLVDTGRYGTTGALLSVAFPDLDISSLLLARAMTLDEQDAGLHRGVSFESHSYRGSSARTAALRHWHFFEQVFEPDLPSVTRFSADGGEVVSDLEVAGWRARLPGQAGSVFAAALAHVEEFAGAPREMIDARAASAWRRLRRALVYPSAADVPVFGVTARSFDFGRSDVWGPRTWEGPVRALRGITLWREGEIAASGTPLRPLLLIVIEGGYNARAIVRGCVVLIRRARSRR